MLCCKLTVVSHRLLGPWEWIAWWLPMKLMPSWPILTKLELCKPSSQRTRTSSRLAVRRYWTVAAVHMLFGGSCVCWGAKDDLTWSTCSCHLISVDCLINSVWFAFVGSGNKPRTLYMLGKYLPLSYTPACECLSFS